VSLRDKAFDRFHLLQILVALTVLGRYGSVDRQFPARPALAPIDPVTVAAPGFSVSLQIRAGQILLFGGLARLTGFYQPINNRTRQFT